MIVTLRYNPPFALTTADIHSENSRKYHWTFLTHSTVNRKTESDWLKHRWRLLHTKRNMTRKQMGNSFCLKNPMIIYHKCRFWWQVHHSGPCHMAKQWGRGCHTVSNTEHMNCLIWGSTETQRQRNGTKQTQSVVSVNNYTDHIDHDHNILLYHTIMSDQRCHIYKDPINTFWFTLNHVTLPMVNYFQKKKKHTTVIKTR